ncbi:glycosyl hydrolase family 16 [Flavobacterium azooxidireducens]|uniref:Glycosyl hydrolase family 16 n=1 Tax=Flavobacterium azooxidireducens TaxID=1871076 RepID=A0ABY4KB67_9FLAO|nr:glycosyl hydrolase family 16 [Flavobacterium azooxidireducens]UPQ78047.1 glycosyl hydrolase family 16 [Flavobacterium azooxidireducens]
MKNIKFNYLGKTLLVGLVLITNLNCERDISDDAVLATFPKTAEIFTDDFVAMGGNFYLPYGGSKPTAFSVDLEQGYNSNSSIRIDVPNATDPEGAYAGAIFRIDGEGRNLTDYDALTFYVKASQGVTVGEFGFGEDFFDNKYITTITNVSIGTNWTKIIIPIPDASKLLQERGMFRYAAGTQGTNGFGYTIWIDELKFEKLGTNSLLYPYILNGQNITIDGYLDSNIEINQLGAVYSLANGLNVNVNAAPSYFSFISSNDLVTGPFQNNISTIISSTGTAVVTAQLGNELAQGSLTINATGAFDNAPDPTTNPANVISIFSDFYSSVPDFNPGVFAGGGTGNISVQNFGNNQHLRYESIDFVGLGWNGPIDVSSKTMVHLDVQLISGSNLVMELIDFGPDGVDNGLGGTDGTAGGNNISGQLQVGQWVSLDIPLNAFTLTTGGGGAGSPNLNNLGYVVFVSGNGASFLVDNIYFYNN